LIWLNNIPVPYLKAGKEVPTPPSQKGRADVEGGPDHFPVDDRA